jgi:hypothetical protein
MRIYDFFLMLIISFAGFQLHASTTVLQGEALDGAGLSIEIITYSDFISNTEKVLASAKIAGNGSFRLSFDNKTTRFVYIRIDKQKTEFFAEPEKEYSLKISNLLEKRLRNEDLAPFQIPALVIEIKNPEPYELNSLVPEYLDFHHNFLSEHSIRLLRQRDARFVEQYCREVFDLFPGINNLFFNQMVFYKTAQIATMGRSAGRTEIFRQYLWKHEILYNHIVYMDFFNLFFDKYLLSTRLFSREEIIANLESPQAYTRMMKMLERDEILEDLQIRELVLLKSLLDLYGTPGYNRQSIKLLLEVISESGSHIPHRMIADNLLNQLRF